jgi:hypothetical protein
MDFVFSALSEPEPGQTLQLEFASLALAPTLAERVFLGLARQWQAHLEAQAEPRKITPDMDNLALACLLLAVEWGKDFTPGIRAQAMHNRDQVEGHSPIPLLDQLPWNLCLCANSKKPPHKQNAVRELTDHLDHPQSGVRLWCMKVAWFVFPWLDRNDTLPLLLTNVADKLGYVSQAVGLASRFFDTPESFFAFAREFEPESYVTQYDQRLVQIKEQGLASYQSYFWEAEAQCRKIIEQACLGTRVTGKDGP